MVIENTVDATPIIDPAMTVRMLLAPSGRAGSSQSTSLRKSAHPLRSSQIVPSASATQTIEKSAGRNQ